MSERFGYVTQVIGPVVDVIFENGGEDLPPIYEASRHDHALCAKLHK